MAQPPKVEDAHLKVIVNGKPVPLKASPDQALQSLIGPALEKANVAENADPARWVFKDEAGNVLDKTRAIGSFGFAHMAVVFLSLEAGVVG